MFVYRGEGAGAGRQTERCASEWSVEVSEWSVVADIQVTDHTCHRHRIPPTVAVTGAARTPFALRACVRC
jgi:hypothetical protein